jgi:hypothetical protein
VPYRSAKEREALGESGKEYADAVIDFMNARGYLLEARAEDTGEQEDLIFVPKAGSRKSIMAEAKYRQEDDGFSPNDYKEGFGERFREWEKGSYQGYEFHLFFSDAANRQLWKNLFEHHKQEVIDNFYGKIVESTEGELHEFLSGHKYTRFERFMENTFVWNYSRRELINRTERAKQEGDYDYNPYMEEYDAVPKSGDHSSNLLMVSELPDTLYKTTALDGTDTRSFYRHAENETNPVHYHGGIIYSLIPPEELPPSAQEFYDSHEIDTEDFGEWSSDSPSSERVDIAKALLRGLLAMMAKENDAEVTRKRGGTRIFTESTTAVDNIQLAKELNKTDEVRHRSIVVDVKHLAGNYFYALTPKQEFTKDGTTLVSGKRKDELAGDFSSGRYPQNKRKKRVVDAWVEILTPDQSLLRYAEAPLLQEISLKRVDGITLEGVRPPKDSKEREDLIVPTTEQNETPNRRLDT